MVDNILNKTGIDKYVTIARFKVGKGSVTPPAYAMTTSEKQLSDIVDIGSAAKDRAEKVRKLDGYLRLFQSYLKFFNGTSSKAAESQIAPLEIEYVKIENPYLKKTDTTA